MFPASAGLSGGGPFSSCSACNIVEMVKGMSRGSIPSFARSSGTIGTTSGEGTSSLVSGRANGSMDYTGDKG